jgi:molybdopterin converting factor small subunit
MLATNPTINARVKFMGDLPTVVGQRSLELTLPAGNTVRDLLGSLSQTYGEAFTVRVFSNPDKLHHYILVFVDGHDIKGHGGLDASLGSGEVDVIMLPMFGGG